VKRKPAVDCGLPALDDPPGRMIRQSGERVGKPRAWIDIVELGGLCRPPNYAERTGFPAAPPIWATRPARQPYGKPELARGHRADAIATRNIHTAGRAMRHRSRSSSGSCDDSMAKRSLRPPTFAGKGQGRQHQDDNGRTGHVHAGWRGDFGSCETPEVLIALTRWVRLRLRVALWRQWKTPRRRIAALIKWGLTVGCKEYGRQRPWPLACHPCSNRVSATSRTSVYGPVPTVARGRGGAARLPLSRSMRILMLFRAAS
jgi:hypothetical protein